MQNVGLAREYYRREAQPSVTAFVKFITVLVVTFWPLLIITGQAFGKHPGVAAWVIGSTAQVLWLGIVVGIWTRQKRLKGSQQGKRYYTHGTCTIQHRSPGAAMRCNGSV